MSTPLPPPPLPPPLTSANDNLSPAATYFAKHTQSKVDMVAELAQNLETLPKLQKDDDDDKVATVFVSPVQPILQIGPVCGLVAVGMAAEYLSPGKVSLDTIFDTAKSQSMTRSGEMFSAQEMRNLTATVIPAVNTDLVNSASPDTFDKVVSSLLNGDLVLVPYDADYNHSPANRNGHAAHWALLIGFVAILPRQQVEAAIASVADLQASKEGWIIFIDTLTLSEKEALSPLLKSLPTSQTFLCARQGKSKHVGLWGYDNLMKSNQNLMEVGAKIMENTNAFVLHPIHLTLRSQLILLQKTYDA